MKKTLFYILMPFLFFANSMAQSNIWFQYFDQYNDLYPDCVDDANSHIYTLDEPYLVRPEFPGGGQVQMTRYVHYVTECPGDVFDENGERIKGKVLVRTVIDRCGVAKDISIIESFSDAHDAEAIRVVESFPIFKPASLDGIRVKVEIMVPVYFTKTCSPKPKYDYEKMMENWDDDWEF